MFTDAIFSIDGYRYLILEKGFGLNPFLVLYVYENVHSICSSNTSFIECKEKLKINLSERGYQINLIKRAIEKAAQLDRNKLLVQAQNFSKSDQIYHSIYT
jgi:hypothetical protein